MDPVGFIYTGYGMGNDLYKSYWGHREPPHDDFGFDIEGHLKDKYRFSNGIPIFDSRLFRGQNPF